MRQKLTEPDDRRSPGTGDPRNRRALVTLLLLCTVMLFLVSGLPPVLVPAALSQMLAYGSLGALIVAAVRREPLFGDHLSHWDQGAALLALGVLAGAFTDGASVGAFLESVSGEASSGVQPLMESLVPSTTESGSSAEQITGR